MKIKLDLVNLIRQAAPQVWGSDERDILYAWLARNTEPTQIVEVDLPDLNESEKPITPRPDETPDKELR